MAMLQFIQDGSAYARVILVTAASDTLYALPVYLPLASPTM